MKPQPGTKLKERCEKIHNQETVWLVGSGVNTVLFLKGGLVPTTLLTIAKQYW